MTALAHRAHPWSRCAAASCQLRRVSPTPGLATAILTCSVSGRPDASPSQSAIDRCNEPCLADTRRIAHGQASGGRLAVHAAHLGADNQRMVTQRNASAAGPVML